MWTEVEYAGITYRVPETGRNEHFDAMLMEVPDDFHAMAFLMQDGDLGVPGGRYGSTTMACAPIAIAMCKIMQYHNGEPMTYHALNTDMGAVVNGNDGVAEMIREWGEVVGLDPDDFPDIEFYEEPEY